MRRVLALSLVALFLSSCAVVVKSQVTVFHDLPASLGGTNYALVPFKEQEGSLEHRSYERLLRQELNGKAFRETEIDQAQVIVVVLYGIDTGRQVVSSYPIIGQTGVRRSNTFGTFQGNVQNYGSGLGNYSGTYSGTTTYTPTYGVVGTGVRSNTEYTRYLKLEILDRNALVDGKISKQYEGKVISSGSTGELSRVVPTMIKSLFEEFPGRSGSSRTSLRVRD